MYTVNPGAGAPSQKLGGGCGSGLCRVLGHAVICMSLIGISSFHYS
jgi:hypothetical protein